MYGLWGKLRECVRAGVPVVPPTQHFGDDPIKTRAFVHAMHSRGLALLPTVIPFIPIPTGANILDIGAGPGTLDRLLLDRDPSLKLALQDLPGIIAQSKELWKDQPKKASVRFIEGDYRQVLPRETFDVVLYSGALHQHPVDQATALFRRLFDVVRPGGKLIVIDLMIGGEGNSSFASLFQLNMLLINPQARVYAASDVREMLTDAGFTETTAIDVPGSIYHVVSGNRSA
jgi:SAM-dependent methyltransferase